MIACVAEVDTRAHDRDVRHIIDGLGGPDLANIRQIEAATVNYLQGHKVVAVGGAVRRRCNAEYVAKGCRPVDNL